MKITKLLTVFLFVVAAVTTGFSNDSNRTKPSLGISGEVTAILSETSGNESFRNFITQSNAIKSYLPSSVNMIFDKSSSSLGFNESPNSGNALRLPDPSEGEGNGNGYGNGCQNGTGNGNGYGCPTSPVR